MIARLQPGVDRERAQAEMSAIMARLEQQYPDDNLGRGAVVRTLEEETVGDVRTSLLVLFGAVGLVLLVACANVANLQLARSSARRRELAVRTALGAGSRRLLRQLLTEGLILASLGAGLGLLLAAWGSQFLVALAPAMPRFESVSLDAPVLLFASAATLLTWLLFALGPAVLAARRPPQIALRQGAEDAPSNRGAALRGSLRGALVVGEVALAVVLVVGAGLLLRSFWRLQSIEPGLRSERVLSVELDLPAHRYPFPEGWPILEWGQAEQLQVELLAHIEALPGVERAALSLYNGLDSGWTTRVTVVGRPVPPAGEQDEAHFRPVSASYFETLGIPVLVGRPLDERDRGGAAPVVVVNEAFVRRHLSDVDPVGQRIDVYGVAREVVGVVADVRYRGRSEPSPPTLYLPLRQNPQNAMALSVRTAGDPLALLPEVRTVLRRLDPELALHDVTTLESLLAGSVGRERFLALLLGSFAGLSLLLAGIGTYGVISYAVSQRTHEIGLRMALGAGRGQVLREVLGRGLGLVLTGVVLGLGAALLLSGLLFGIGERDLLTFAAVPAVLAVIAFLASWLPARRASRIEPLAALRHE